MSTMGPLLFIWSVLVGLALAPKAAGQTLHVGAIDGGTAFLVRRNSTVYIVTSLHVISGIRSRSIRLLSSGDRTIFSIPRDSELQQACFLEQSDIAIFPLRPADEAPLLRDLGAPLRLGTAGGVRLGSAVSVLAPIRGGLVRIEGRPGQALAEVRTAGQAFGRARPSTPERSSDNITLSGGRILLHTAPVRPGTSGAPVLDGEGRVIGVHAGLVPTDGDMSPGVGTTLTDVDFDSCELRTMREWTARGLPSSAWSDVLRLLSNATEERLRQQSARRVISAGIRLFGSYRDTPRRVGSAAVSVGVSLRVWNSDDSDQSAWARFEGGYSVGEGSWYIQHHGPATAASAPFVEHTGWLRMALALRVVSHRLRASTVAVGEDLLDEPAETLRDLRNSLQAHVDRASRVLGASALALAAGFYVSLEAGLSAAVRFGLPTELLGDMSAMGPDISLDGTIVLGLEPALSSVAFELFLRLSAGNSLRRYSVPLDAMLGSELEGVVAGGLGYWFY